MSTTGQKMYDLMKKLFPIPRSLTGNGVRETLKILQEHIPLNITEVKSGTKVFDWTVPKEWNVNDAYIKNAKGEKIVDFKKSNLHLVGYSIPFRGKINLVSLKEHLYSLPEMPDVVPYITSYYAPRWGFCLTHNQFLSLKDEEYEVVVDTTLEDGSLTYGELIIPGTSNKEILLSTYCCHPSLANNELSGLVLATFLAKHLQNKDNFYTYRFVFVPETIGSIAYLSTHLKHLQENVIGGYVITCVGDNGPISYLRTPYNNTLVDKITQHLFKFLKEKVKIHSYLERGSDERQYCSALVNLPIGSVMRTKYGNFKEYHTSLDDLNFVQPQFLQETFEIYLRLLNIFEKNKTYIATICCEPQLGKRGLYSSLGTAQNYIRVIDNISSFANGKNDLVDIAEYSQANVEDLFETVDILLQHNLIRES